MSNTAARLAISARRNEVVRFTIVVTGIDMTGVTMSMQVRSTVDNPVLLFALGTVNTLAAEGLKFDSVTVSDGIPTSVIKGRINASTMTDQAKVPYVGEIGADAVFAYAMQWTLGGDARTRLFGDFIVLGSAFGSDNAPSNRPPSYGFAPSTSSFAGGGGSLTFGDQVIGVSIEGREYLSPYIDAARTQADRAAATVAEGVNKAALSAGTAIERAAFSGAAATRSEAARDVAVDVEKTIRNVAAGSGQVIDLGEYGTDGQQIDLGQWSETGVSRRLTLPYGPQDVSAVPAFTGEVRVNSVTGAMEAWSPTGRFTIISRAQDVLHLDQFTNVYLNTATGAQFTAAMMKAEEAVYQLGGGQVHVPIRPDKVGYALDQMEFRSNFRVRGVGGQAAIRPATACADWLTANGQLIDLDGLWLNDPGSLVGGAAIVTKQANRSDYANIVRNVTAVGFKNALRNDGAQALRLENNFFQNNETGILNAFGGVDMHIDDHASLGEKYPLIIDSKTVPVLDHAEGISLQRFRALAVQAGGVGIWVKDILWLKGHQIEVVQLGVGAVGIFLDGTKNAITLIDLQQGYIEGGQDAPAIKARGTVDRVRLRGGALGTGTRSNVFPLDLVGVNKLSIMDVEDFYGTGPIKISGSNGLIGGTTDFSTATGFEGAANALRWDIPEDRLPPGMVKENTCQFPQSAWRTFVPEVLCDVGRAEQIGTCVIKWQWDGRTLDCDIFVQIIKFSADAAGAVVLSLPKALLGELQTSCFGIDNSITAADGKDVTLIGRTGGAGTNHIVITKRDLSTPIHDGLVIDMSMRGQQVGG